jgi:hypothetical protein
MLGWGNRPFQNHYSQDFMMVRDVTHKSEMKSEKKVGFSKDKHWSFKSPEG